MNNTVKFLLAGCFVILYNCGFSQCNCDDIKIIEIKDTTISSQAFFTFKLTTESSNCGGNYADFWFVDQTGDTINEWTGSSMWMPNPLDPMFDTTEYIIQLRPGYSSFPTSFSGNLQVVNQPDCLIPLIYATLTTNKIIELKPDIQFFPNPTSEEILISNKSHFEITSIELYNSTGKLLLSKSNHLGKIKVNKLNAGIYYIKVYSDDKLITTKKIIKN